MATRRSRGSTFAALCRLSAVRRVGARHVALLVLALAGPAFSAPPAGGTPATDRQAEAARLAEELQQLSLKGRALDREATDAEARSEAAAGRLRQVETDIAASEAHLAAARDLLATIAVEAYLRGSGAALLGVLLDKGVVTGGARSYVDSVMTDRRRAIRTVQAAQGDLATRRSDVEAVHREAEDDAQRAAVRREEAQATMTRQKAVLEKVRGEVADLVAAEAAEKAKSTTPPPVVLPTGTALTPTAKAGEQAGRDAGAARSNTAPAPPPTPPTPAAVPPPPPAPTTPTTTATTATPTTVVATGSPVPTTPTTTAPTVATPAAPLPDAARFVTFRVFATQYEPHVPGSVEVAIPDKCAKWAALAQTANLKKYGCPAGYAVGLDYRVLIRRDSGPAAVIPVKDVGPWSIDDNYWNSAAPGSARPRRMFTTLEQGKPASQAGFYNGFNVVPDCQKLDGTPSGKPGGADQFGRCVLNPAGIDLSPAAASQIGLTGLKNEWITVSFLWEPK